MPVITILIVAVTVMCLLTCAWYAALLIQQHFERRYQANVATGLKQHTAEIASVVKRDADNTAIVLARSLQLSMETAASQKLLLVIVGRTNDLFGPISESQDETLRLLRELIAQGTADGIHV